MKKFLIMFWCSVVTLPVMAQVGITYHNAYDNFLGVNYEFKNGLIPEARLHTNRYMDDMDLEIALNFLVLKKEEFQFYVGLGMLAEVKDGDGLVAVLPVGLNFYPFTRKNFGFHLEAAPLIDGEGPPYFRTSWGIRYRFSRN